LNQNGNIVDIKPYLTRPSLVDGLNKEELAALLEQLKGLEGRVMARLLLDTNEQSTSAESDHSDNLLTVDEAARKLKVSRDWVYRHADRLAFTVRLGPGQLRFSEHGIERFIRQRQGSRKV
jgi:excisionase family DNA binding protein